jgi:peroxiredoxin
MAQFESNTAEIRQAKLQVVFIAAQSRGGVFAPEKYFQEHAISYPFLLDEDRSVTKAYGVYQWVGFDGVNIAHPATFLIDEKGITRYIHVGDTQWERAPLEEVLSVAEDLRRTRRRAGA